jgi:hypothetical protein
LLRRLSRSSARTQPKHSHRRSVLKEFSHASSRVHCPLCARPLRGPRRCRPWKHQTKGCSLRLISRSWSRWFKIEGKAGKPEVTQNGDTLVVKVPLKGHLKTGIDLRDKHCGKAINVDTWPASSFSAKIKDLKFPAPGKKVDDASITGDFKFNGVTKPMTFTYDAEFDKGNVVVKGHGTFDYTQFKVEEQCYLGVCVKKDVKISVEFTVERDR